MANCYRCGSEIIPGAKFCSECGAPVEQPFEAARQTYEEPSFEQYNQQGAWSNADAQAQYNQQAGAYYNQGTQYNQQPYNQGYQQYNQGQYQQQYNRGQYEAQYNPYAPEGQYGQKNRIAAGILAILLGGLGIHKFYLGYTSTGIIMLLVTLLTFGIGAIVMAVISLVEGILYLTKSDYEFYETYELNQKKWF